MKTREGIVPRWELIDVSGQHLELFAAALAGQSGMHFLHEGISDLVQERQRSGGRFAKLVEQLLRGRERPGGLLH